jgi:uncharacterized membrane protein
MDWRRALRHLFTTPWAARRAFPPATLAEIEAAVAESERRHGGEIRFAVEHALDLVALWRDVPPRAHALSVFGELGVWDTAANNGVLIFVCLADRDVEIVADRGIADRVAPEEWERVCREMEAHYREGRFREGSLAGIRGVGDLLAHHFPPREGDRDEVPDRPVVR